jgi:hypothetical protein
MPTSGKDSTEPRTEPAPAEPATGTGGFFGQIGLFEAGNGLAHGPAAIALAVAAAIVIYPVMRLVRMARGR